MNKKLKTIIQFGCALTVIANFCVYYYLFDEYINFHLNFNKSVTFSDYHYAFMDKNYELMADYTVKVQDSSDDVDATSYYNFGLYYRFLQQYLCSNSLIEKQMLIDKMKALYDAIDFITVKLEIDYLNQTYEIQFN